MLKMKCYFYIVLLFTCCHLINCQQQCRQDCSTTSKNAVKELNKYHLVPCTIQSRICNGFEEQDKPPPFAAAPKRIPKDPEWYLVDDFKHRGFKKIALNFSWHPTQVTSIKYLHGYAISVHGPKSFSYQGYNRSIYFCFNKTLNYKQHVLSTFFYDCFGLSSKLQFAPSIVSKSEPVSILIQSLPYSHGKVPDNALKIEISIPSCDDLRFKDVYECKQRDQFVLSLGNISCENRSVEFYYNLPSFFGKGYALLNSLKYPDATPYAAQKIAFESSQAKVVAVLPENYSLHENYSIAVVSTKIDFQRTKMFNFTECIPSGDSSPSLGVVILLPLLAFIILVIFVAGCCLKWDVMQIRLWIRKDEGNHNKIKHNKAQETKFAKILGEIEEKWRQHVDVFIIFVDDHPKHQKIVLDFANFLHGDLEFNVTSELFQTEEIYADPATWMEDGLTKADKVIVIWSPGACRRWKRYNGLDSVEQDLFTPVLKRIKKDIFRDRNIRKYYFGYFDYCTVDDIPIVFKESPVFHFKLMKQFEELYFRLKEIEMYLPGAIMRRDEIAFDHYFDPNINKFGPTLEKSICEMCVYVKENPEWYLEQHKTISVLDLPRIVADTEILTTRLDLIPPKPISTSSVLKHPHAKINTRAIVNEKISNAMVPSNMAPKHPNDFNRPKSSVSDFSCSGYQMQSSLLEFNQKQQNGINVNTMASELSNTCERDTAAVAELLLSDSSDVFVKKLHDGCSAFVQDSGFDSFVTCAKNPNYQDGKKPSTSHKPVEQEMPDTVIYSCHKLDPVQRKAVLLDTHLLIEQNEHSGYDSDYDSGFSTNTSPLVSNAEHPGELLDKLVKHSSMPKASFMSKDPQFKLDLQQNNAYTKNQLSLQLAPVDMVSDAMDCLAAINNLSSNVC